MDSSSCLRHLTRVVDAFTVGFYVGCATYYWSQPRRTESLHGHSVQTKRGQLIWGWVTWALGHSDTSCRTCCSTCVRVLSHWPHVRQQVCVARSSSEQMTSLARKCVETCCSTCVQCERFQQHSRTHVQQQVAQLVASVNSSVEIHGEYKFSNKFSNLLLNLLNNMWPVWKHYKTRQGPTSHRLRVIGLMLNSLTISSSWYMCSSKLSICRQSSIVDFIPRSQPTIWVLASFYRCAKFGWNRYSQGWNEILKTGGHEQSESGG